MGKSFDIRIFYVFLVWLLSSLTLHSQSISISENGNQPHESAMLDIRSQNKGILIPRVSLDNINSTKIDGENIAATGLLIYNSNPSTVGGNGVGFYSFNGSIWEKIITNATPGSVDIDFFEEGSNGAPNDINDDMYTHGHVGIGTESADYPLDVETKDDRGINTLMTGEQDDQVVGHYINNLAGGSGRHIGSYSGLGGTGTGIQYGNFQSIFNNGDGIHYGSFNSLIGSGSGIQFGSGQSISNNGSGIHYGIHNSLSGTGTGQQYGSYQWISNSGDAEHYGTYNLLSGSGPGLQYGARQEITNTGNGGHVGVSNLLSGSGQGAQTGTLNEVNNIGSSVHYGTRNILSGTGSGMQVGTRQSILNSGNGIHYGSRSTLGGTGSGDQYGTYQSISNSGNGNHYGSYNTISGDGSGVKYGSYNAIEGNGGSEVVASYQGISVIGGVDHYGSYNNLSGSTDFDVMGAYQYISSSGDGNHYGVRNILHGDGNGSQIGTLNSITNSGVGNKYGSYNTIPASLPGLHYGVYSSVLKAENFAGYFNGNVYIGTDNVSGPRPNLQISGGSDASYLDGSGDLAIGEIDEANIVFDVNEILARNNGNSAPLFIQKDGGNLLLASDELGAVGIGVGSDANMPAGFLLAVDGRVIAEEIQVEVSGSWPDYVFEDSYQLKDLVTLENEISELGHLPGLPSAEQAKNEGIQLGLMQQSLLEKIEELTLYMIEANKEIKALRNENETLSIRLDKVEIK